MDAQGMYRMARDSGWEIERVPRMWGVSVHVHHPSIPGVIAGAFGSTEDAAWAALARDWDDDDFWFREAE